MASKTTFVAEVLTPEGAVFKDEVQMVSTRTDTGSLGILAGHQPLLGLLAPAELRLYTGETDFQRFAQGEGYVQVTGDHVLILVEDAIDPDELDESELGEKLKKAESEADSADEHSEAKKLALRDKRRWETFIRVARGEQQ